MIDRYTLPKMKEIWSEESKFQSWLDVEIAVCEAWARLGKIPREALSKIKQRATFSIKRINEIEKTVDHDMIAFITSVAEKVGSGSRFIHIGLTSNDVVDTAQSLRLKRASKIIIDDINDLIKALKKKAKMYRNTVMMGRTHGVHAEPTTFGLKMALFMAEMQRNLERMKRATENISVGKLSGAVGTYSNIDPKVEDLTLAKLGLKRDPITTQVVQRDRHAEYMTTLAIIGSTLEKIATEIRGLQKTEINEVEEPFKKGQKGSSAMPHKKNPITCERICGLARVVRANSMVALENNNLWHERDISHSGAERIILPDSTILIDYMLRKMINIIDNLVVHRDNMKANLDKTGGLIFSQRLLLTLIDKGITREDAYTIAQCSAMKARAEKKDYIDVVKADNEVRKLLKPQEIEKVFDINHYLRNINKIYKRIGL